jgi:hypothetical protein
VPAPSVRLVHRLPSRIRLHARTLMGHPEATRIATDLAREAGVDRVGIRPMTGSVIVEGPPGELDPEGILLRLSTLVGELEAKSPRSSERLETATTRLAEAISRSFRELNAQVREALHGEADLGSLTSVFLGLASLAEVSVTGKLPAPSWSSLLWYSLRSFSVFNPALETSDSGSGAKHP